MRRLHLASIAAAALAVAAHGQGRADTLRDQVVAHVGPRAVTLGQIEDRIAEMPPFQRVSFGSTADAIRRRVLEEIVVPEHLLSLGAERDRVGDKEPTKLALDRARSSATVRAIRARIGPAASIPMKDVAGYYDANRSRYDTPERIQVWRILCKTRDEAEHVLDAAKKEPTPKEFGDLARERSIDKATYLRAGNLGFLSPDGASNEPGLRADPAIMSAAAAVRDGEFVPAPVPEGDAFAVVWRRGTIAPSKRTVDDVAAQIRDTIWKGRVEQETAALKESLRAGRLRDLHEDLLVTIDLPAPDGPAGARSPSGHAGDHRTVGQPSTTRTETTRP